MRYKAFIPFLSGIRLIGTFEAESYEACGPLNSDSRDRWIHEYAAYLNGNTPRVRREVAARQPWYRRLLNLARHPGRARENRR